ncbi:hypothetical protein KSB_48020 [Ktedonobacter robiniae]|uniref:Uncharacterized protein n=1 Tax=Ktedonobacter robiniae TaxID=2778365 RepID=A0ABQ3UUS0_9CHLR|nr:hypothetical protein KSB_48020 [Ktedonobacter robiniae]
MGGPYATSRSSAIGLPPPLSLQARSGKQNRCSFLGPGEAALGFGQSVLFLTKKPGVVNVGAIGEKGKGLEGLIHRLVKPLQ